MGRCVRGRPGFHGGDGVTDRQPSIAIVIPTRNGMQTLPDVVEAIRSQQAPGPVALIAIDTASTDGTPGYLHTLGFTVIAIEEHAFNHGRARNAAIAACRTELVVLLSQDAVPANAGWLDALTAPLARDRSLAGTWARQQPRPDAGAVARHYLAGYEGSRPDPFVAHVKDIHAFNAMAPASRLQLCTFDNVCSCIRRDVWEQHPFPESPIGEDVAWARTVLLAGHRLAYVPEAVVTHSHDRTATDEFVRTAALHEQLHVLFGLRSVPNLAVLFMAVASSLRLHMRLLRRPSATSVHDTLWKAMSLAVAWPLAQYIGGCRGARAGRDTPGGAR